MSLFLQYTQSFLIIGLEIYQFLLLIYVISSWFGGMPKNKLGYFVIDLLVPIMELAKKIPHRIGVIDISPIYAFFIIGLAKALVITIFNY